MFNLIKQYRASKKLEEDFQSCLYLVSLLVYNALIDQYKKKMDVELAPVLSSQVFNYLTGTDVQKVYEESEEPLKSRIGMIKDDVRREALLLMDKDTELREIILRTLWLRDTIDRAHYGQAYLDSKEKDQIDFLLSKYGNGDFQIDHVLYLKLAKDLLDKRMPNSELKVLYELEDVSGFKFTVFNDKFEIQELGKSKEDKVTFALKDFVAVDMFKAKELTDPDYIAIFTEDGDGIHKHMFALAQRGEVDKLYRVLRKIIPKNSFYLLKKFFSKIFTGYNKKSS